MALYGIMKKYLGSYRVWFVFCICVLACDPSTASHDVVQPRLAPISLEQTLAQAFAQQRSNLQVQGKGRVIKVLSDDIKGSRHQRFIVQLDSGQTLLIAHNIDLAPRITDLSNGDWVEFYGEYEWNSKGGVLHWTHRDPKGRHASGWLKHKGQIYQ